jgi:hypothetical protein
MREKLLPDKFNPQMFTKSMMLFKYIFKLFALFAYVHIVIPVRMKLSYNAGV